MVAIQCAYCGDRFEPFGNYENYRGPVPCAGCHRATWISVEGGVLIGWEKWPPSVETT